MNTAKDLEKVVESLPIAELREFRAWFERFDSENWDKKIENDIDNGSLDKLAQKALASHRANRSEEI